MTNRYYDHPPVGYSGPINANVYCVGEAPGEIEVRDGEPFVGPAGDKLTQVLDRNGLPRSTVRLLNLSPVRPWNNKFENLLKSDVLARSVDRLKKEILTRRPNVVIALGKWPCYYLAGKPNITPWRGSILPFIDDPSIKVIPTYHPSFVLRDPSVGPIFDIDIRRCAHDSKFPEFNYPTYNWTIDPEWYDIGKCVSELCAAPIISCDIETIKGTSTILCVGFATSATRAIVFVPKNDAQIRAIQQVLEHPNKKIFQNGTFDTIQLRLNNYAINYEETRRYYWDTRTAQHVIQPELPRSLDFMCSIYTRQPHYKGSGRENIPSDVKSWSARSDRNALYRYNATDCCVTFGVYEGQVGDIESSLTRKATFEFEMSELEMTEHISMSGMLRDEKGRVELQQILVGRWAKKQIVLDAIIGEHCNTKSPKLKKHLYDKEHLGLPARKHRDKKTGKSIVTTDEDAIVSLINYCKTQLRKVSRADAVDRWKRKLVVCKLILEIRGVRQALASYVNAECSSDGRVRSTFNTAATDTGRWSASKFVDGTGYNMQTNPRDSIEYEDNELAGSLQSLQLIAHLADDIKQFRKLDISEWEIEDDDAD